MTATIPLLQHHPYSASGAEGWLNCAGKRAMEQGIPDSYSPYADEGSAAHFLGAECLAFGQNPIDFLGRTIICWEKDGDRDGQCFSDQPLPDGATERSRWPVTQEMCDNLDIYVRLVRKYAEGNHLMVEQRVHFGEAIGQPGAFGTSDVIILVSGDKEVIIVDLKYGHKPVSAVENRQMMLYALGTLREFEMLLDPDALEQVRMVICQPRIDNVSEWVCPINDLIAFAEEAKAAIEMSEEAIVFSNTPNDIYENFDEWANAYLKTSEKGCQWCKAKAGCPTLAKEVMGSIIVPEATADDLPRLDYLTGADHPPSLEISVEAAAKYVQHLDFDTVARLFGVLPKIQMWVDAIETRMLVDMLRGQKHPDYKLVKGRAGNRKWSDATEVETIMKASKKLKVDDIYDRTVISPAAAEKLLAKTQPRVWNKLENLVVRSEGKIVVAPRNDKRESLDPHADAMAALPDLDFSDVLNDIV